MFEKEKYISVIIGFVYQRINLIKILLLLTHTLTIRLNFYFKHAAERDRENKNNSQIPTRLID